MPNIRTLCIIGGISSLTVLTGSILAPIEARYIQIFTDNPVVIGTVFGSGSVFLAIASLYVGRLSDRVGRKKLILLGLFFGVIYALLYSIVLNVFQMYGVKLAWAFSAVATGPVLAAYLQDFLAPFKNKGRYFGYVYSAQAISGSIGALLGGYVANVYGLHVPFVIVAGVFLLLFFITLFFLPVKSEQHFSSEKKHRSVLQIFSYIASQPALVFYLSANTSFGINWGIKVFLWPLIIFELSKSDFVTGAIFATMGFVAFVLLPFSGRVVDRINPYRVIIMELIILGTAGIGLVFATDITAFWVFAALYTIGEVLNGPAQSVLLTENVDPDIRGTVMGLDSSMDQILGVMAPLLAGALIVLMGLTYTLLFFIVLFWCSLLFSLHIYKKAGLGQDGK